MTPLRKLISTGVALIVGVAVTLLALNLPDAVVTPDDRYICRGTQYYALQSVVNSSYVLDVTNGNLQNGAEIQMWTWVGGANQIWFFDGGMVRTLLNGKCLDRMNTTNVTDPNYGHVHLWDCQYWNPNQYWSLNTNNDKPEPKPFQLVHTCGECLMPVTTPGNGGKVKTLPCTKNSTWQTNARS
jgi:hypothetical protein